MEQVPTIKILTLGDASVGKTCILLRFADNMFPLQTMPTIGIEFKSKDVNVKGKNLRLQIWDTAGQERYHRTLTSSIYRRANGILLVFDLTDRESFTHVSMWMSQIREKAEGNVSIVLVGNKADLSKTTDFPDAVRLAESYNIPFFVTSAKTGLNIENVFMTLADIIVQNDPTIGAQQDVKNPSVIKPAPGKSPSNSEGGCCK